MGLPPAHTTWRRIVKSFFKNKLPRNLADTFEVHQKLKMCWAKNGMDSVECRALEQEYMKAGQNDAEYHKYVKQVNYKKIVNQYLVNAGNKYDVRGREKIYYRFNPNKSRFQLKNIDLSDNKDN